MIMKTFAELKKNKTRLLLSEKFGTGKLNPYFPAGREVQHAWTNPHMIQQAAKELGVKPRSIACIIETI